VHLNSTAAAPAATRPRFDPALLPTTTEYLERHLSGRFSKGRERRGRCPIASHGSRDPFSISAATGLWTCHACGIGGDLVDLHRRTTGLDFVDAVRDLGAWVKGETPTRAPQPAAPAPMASGDGNAARKQAQASLLYAQSQALRGTVAQKYLERRGCALPPADGDLRFIPRLSLFGFEGPAMVGRITDALDYRRALGLHITWLKPDGTGRGERRYLGQKAGGVVRLWPDEEVTLGLAVAEGIETALAAAHAFAPIWACMDAGNLAELPVLGGVDALTVFADRDVLGTGQRAAAKVASRWLAAGREARIVAPAQVGRDIADEVAA
jgi:putative DNA primase/helicase